jgi:hypothetical protein
MTKFIALALICFDPSFAPRTGTRNREVSRLVKGSPCCADFVDST